MLKLFWSMNLIIHRPLHLLQKVTKIIPGFRGFNFIKWHYCVLLEETTPINTEKLEKTYECSLKS